jgi:hypothetical protein
MTNLMLMIKVKKYICHKSYQLIMNNDLKLSDSTIVRINNNQAEIIVENSYRLLITLYQNKVIAKYGDVSITVEYNKFNAEKLARKIYVIVQQSHRFSISIIQRTLQLLKIDEFVSEVLGTESKENTELLKQIVELLSKS